MNQPRRWENGKKDFEKGWVFTYKISGITIDYFNNCIISFNSKTNSGKNDLINAIRDIVIGNQRYIKSFRCCFAYWLKK